MWYVEHKAGPNAKWRVLGKFATEQQAVAYAGRFDEDGLVLLPYRVRFVA